VHLREINDEESYVTTLIPEGDAYSSINEVRDITRRYFYRTSFGTLSLSIRYSAHASVNEIKLKPK
jgi:hypothetical protein